MRRSRGLAVAAVLLTSALALAACSSDDSGSSGSSTDTQSAGAAGSEAELSFWTWAPNMDKVVDIWNAKNNGIHVTVNKQDGGDPAVTKLLTAIKAGSGAPDLMQVEYQALPTLVSADALSDISGDVDGSIKGHFSDGVWNSVTLGTDAVYAIPQDSGPTAFYYRADIFESMGLKVPTTWDEYAQVAAQLHTADPTKYLGTFSATDAGWFTAMAQQAGASWWGIDGDAWNVNINSDATLKVADYWGGLVESGVIDNKPMYTPEWNAALNDGSQIGWLSASWAPGVLSGNAGDTAGKWKMAPMPQWDASKPATGNWGGSSTGVTTQSKNQAAAVKFATWLNTDQEAVTALAQISGVYPADIPGQAIALSSPPEFFSNQPDFYTLMAQIAKTVSPFTYGPNVNVAYSAYNDEFGKAAEAKSQKAFTDAVESMQTITVDDMKNSGFTVK